MSKRIYIICKDENTGEEFNCSVKGSAEHQEAMFNYCMADFSSKKVAIVEYNTVDQDGLPVGAEVLQLECI